MNTCRKCGGSPCIPVFCFLQSSFANRCSSVFICGYTSWLFLPASFTSFAFFTGHGDRFPLCNCQRWVAEAAGFGGRRCKLGKIASGMGAFKRTFIGALYCFGRCIAG